jgi:cellulose biosynthesis protein BcsQ
MENVIAYLRDFIAFLELHPGLFVALGGVATVLGAIAGCVFQFLSMRKQRNELRDELGKVQRKLLVASEKEGSLRQETIHLQNAVTKLNEEKNQMVATFELERAEATADRNEASRQHTIKQEELSHQIEQYRDEIDARDRAIQRQANIVKKMMQIEGQLWEKRALTGTPRFKALRDRRTPIVSVLNLKGGVGKTTIVAHLAAAFAAKGYRVLAVDLDLQGSLSGMFIPGTLIKEKYDGKLLLQHFLNTATHKRKVNLLDYIEPVFDDAKSGLVATSDKLAYAEMNLTMSWLLKLARKDTRFLLRRALHQKRVWSKYDIVLLDCPPLINTCCVNALAACDYVLIPTLPGKKSTERVPLLLETVKRLKLHVNPNLEVAGVILNRTHGAELTAHESDLWNQVLAQGQDRMGVPLYGFQTIIRQNREVRQLESEATHLQPGTDLFEAFRRLAEELEGRLPRECRRLANAPY